MISALTASQLNTQTLQSHQLNSTSTEIASKSKATILGKALNMTIDETTPYVLSSDSKVRLGYQGEFMRTYLNASDGHTALTESTAKKYAELRAEIIENCNGNEDETFKQLGELNQAFETALKNTCIMPIYSTKVCGEIRISYTEEERIRNEAELEALSSDIAQYNQNVHDVRENFQNNMLKHMDTFYESFIKSIQTNDFDTAFSESMTLLNNTETTSYKEISYKDMLKIVDTFYNEATKFDEDRRPTQYRYQTAEDAFRALTYDDGISYCIRKEISSYFGFIIKQE